jgi:hypothetical protein
VLQSLLNDKAISLAQLALAGQEPEKNRKKANSTFDFILSEKETNECYFFNRYWLRALYNKTTLLRRTNPLSTSATEDFQLLSNILTAHCRDTSSPDYRGMAVVSSTRQCPGCERPRNSSTSDTPPNCNPQ